MGRSLSLAAYRALTWRGARPADGSMPSRPKGELLWVHVTTQQRFVAVGDLCRRLLAQRSGLNVLFTCPSEASRAFWDKPSAMLTVAPADHLNAARAFLDHWKPNLCLWSGGELRPNVINQTANRNIPMILMDVGEVDLQVHRHRWLPDLTRTTLEFFDTILVNGEQTARQMQRSGVRSSKISVSAELRVSPNPTPWPEEELNQTTATLGGRPVWLAAWVKQGELPSVLWAHKNALRLLHRLVLVLHIEEGGEQAVLLQQLRAMNLRVADWDAGDPIEDNTQVILSNTTEDLGLWYRMAPVSFLGGSLNPGSGGHDPLNAIALGSALLYGPNIGSHIETYARLAAAGAARCVRDSEALSENVVSLLSPDRAAEMALAGWRVVTESAFLTDQLIELIEDRLDGIESTDARP